MRLIGFFGASRTVRAPAAPIEYIEMKVLPREGWPRSEQERLSIADRHLLLKLHGWEAIHLKRE